MYQLTYHHPQTLDEAARLFGEADDASYLSGGHTLLPTLKGRLAAPSALIDLRDIPDLHGVALEGGRLVIGAATPHAQVARSAVVRHHLPVVAELAGSIGDIHVRNFGTIGGSLANNDPAADYPSAALAMDVIVQTNLRDITADDYFAGLFSTSLKPGEIVTRISFPTGAECGYAKFRHPASRYAMAATFVARFCDRVRVAVTGAGSNGVFRWLEAEERLSESFTPAALEGLAVDPDGMMEDMSASAEYRANLVAVMTVRAVANMGHATITP